MDNLIERHNLSVNQFIWLKQVFKTKYYVFCWNVVAPNWYRCDRIVAIVSFTCFYIRDQIMKVAKLCKTVVKVSKKKLSVDRWVAKRAGVWN